MNIVHTPQTLAKSEENHRAKREWVSSLNEALEQAACQGQISVKHPVPEDLIYEALVHLHLKGFQARYNGYSGNLEITWSYR